MGISRDSLHKRRLTGARKLAWHKKRKYAMGRQPANTRIGPKRVHTVRVRGGSLKFRALRLESGNFSWASESVTRRTRILGVVYNASNNELVRTNTLVKGCIVQIDATPYRQWHETHYGTSLAKAKADAEPVKRSRHALARAAANQKNHHVESNLSEQFQTGRLYACIASRPGQVGRADGYILEGKELEFYQRKLSLKKKH